jgi:hypothetical protein
MAKKLAEQPKGHEEYFGTNIDLKYRLERH